MKTRVVALGVTGSIAAYKAAELTSQLVKAGCEVHVLMTAAALRLVGEQTFFTLSRQPVVTSLWEIPDWKPGHIDLAERADLLIVAPCTANFMGKYAHGLADDALTTFAISFTGPTLLAPAMNHNMWHHPAVRSNHETLLSRAVNFVGPSTGALACGTTGDGRMAEPAEILAAAKGLLS